ncbi:MAG: NAD(P)H-hydrate dehydratase [Actinobacteria bacterium]|nr:NAD(P)H-hydrate dehydratase [Actinomycetota bacterium]
MHYAFTAEQMRAIEDRADADGVATVAELMRRAGATLAAEVSRRVPSGPVVAVCGTGNNGGDGWVAAKLLHEAGRDVRVVALAAPGDLSGSAADAAVEATRAGVPFDLCGQHRPLERTAVVIDALFGFGLRGAMREPAARLVPEIALCGAAVIAADVPSGVDADTGAVTGAAVSADVTVTFTARKPGLLIYPGASFAGEVVVADIGVPKEMLSAPGALELPGVADVSSLLPVAPPDAHKGSRGRVAIVAGSRAYAGAAVLAAQGALRMGAGYVYAVVPEVIGDVIRASLPGAIVRAVPAAADGTVARLDAVLSSVADADAVVVGPGLTTAPGVGEVVHALLTNVSVPLVLDADALNALAGDMAAIDSRTAPLVLTPHPGEASRLLGISAEGVQADRVGAALALSRGHHVCLLKGARTVIAGAGRSALILTGNAGLARAGSGDVLAGMAGTLLAQGVAPFDAAVLSAHLHGRAAEYGTAALTETCFTSADIVTFLPEAVRELTGG